MKPSTPLTEVVLITGGAGFIGTHLAQELLSRNHRVVSLDLRGEGTQPVLGVTYLRGDAREQAKIVRILQDYKITVVYHFAATVSVPLCQNDPVESYSHNVNATLAVLEACRNERQRRMTESETAPLRVAFASSAALYGSLGDHHQSLDEKEIASRFSSFYAAQKHASEKMIELYCDFFQVPALIFRFFNVYGPGQDPTSPYSGVITVFSRLAQEGKTLPLNGGGVQTRDFIAVSDLVRAVASALLVPPSNWNATVLNLGSGTRTTVRELAELILTVSQSKSKIIDAPARAGDVQHSLADIRKARDFLGFAPSAVLPAKLAELLGRQPSHTLLASDSATRFGKNLTQPAPEKLHPPVSSPVGP